MFDFLDFFEVLLQNKLIGGLRPRVMWDTSKVSRRSLRVLLVFFVPQNTHNTLHSLLNTLLVSNLTSGECGGFAPGSPSPCFRSGFALARLRLVVSSRYARQSFGLGRAGKPALRGTTSL